MNSLFSGKNNLLKFYSIFLVLFISLTFYVNTSTIFIENLPNYLLYSFVLVSLVTLFFLLKKKEEELFTIDEGYLVIHKAINKNQSNQKLAFEDIKFFETRFNEIVFYDVNDQKFSVKLDDIKSDKKRWEIKEFLRRHVREYRRHHSYAFEERLISESA